MYEASSTAEIQEFEFLLPPAFFFKNGVKWSKLPENGVNPVAKKSKIHQLFFKGAFFKSEGSFIIVILNNELKNVQNFC